MLEKCKCNIYAQSCSCSHRSHISIPINFTVLNIKTPIVLKKACNQMPHLTFSLNLCRIVLDGRQHSMELNGTYFWSKYNKDSTVLYWLYSVFYQFVLFWKMVAIRNKIPCSIIVMELLELNFTEDVLCTFYSRDIFCYHSKPNYEY